MTSFGKLGGKKSQYTESKQSLAPVASWPSPDNYKKVKKENQQINKMRTFNYSTIALLGGLHQRKW